MYTAELRPILLLLGCACLAAAQSSAPPASIEAAFNRLYNFDFAAAHQILDRHNQVQPNEPLTFSVRAAANLFSELHRLKILEMDFFLDDDRVVERGKLTPDPGIRQAFLQDVATAERLAEARLAAKPEDPEALFALCMTSGVVMDYAALIERRRLGSFSLARRTHAYAKRLVALRPPVYDAYMTYGTIEYVLGSMPFFLRWFIRFDQIDGDKQSGIHELDLVAERGRYYGPLARVMLSVIHMREKRPAVAEKLLSGLVTEFPENPLFQRELARVRKQVRASAPAPLTIR
jgi:hypothetical protein